MTPELSTVEWLQYAVYGSELHTIVSDPDDPKLVCYYDTFGEVLEDKESFLVDFEKRVNNLTTDDESSKLSPFITKLLLHRLHEDLKVLRDDGTGIISVPEYLTPKPPSPPAPAISRDGNTLPFLRENVSLLQFWIC